jgi:hypothetical protein
MPSLIVLLSFVTSCTVLYTGWDWGWRGLKSAWTSSKRPNIVFILTDDQDLHMNSLDYMPHTQKLIADQGTTFANHFCTNALCCPSRVTIWTGLSPHNTNVTDVNPPHGVYSVFCHLNMSCSLTTWTRWLPQIHLPRVQQGLPSSLAPVRGLQYLLRGQALQCSKSHKLRQTSCCRLHCIRLSARPIHVRIPQRNVSA